MFELDGSQFEKGQLEIRVKKKALKYLTPFMILGPIRGRLLVLATLMVAAFSTVQRQPGNFFIAKGWVHSPESAALVQNIFSWGLCAVAVALWLVFLLLQEEELVLNFDKTKMELKTRYTPALRQRVAVQGLYPFKDISEIRVSGKSAEAPFGSIEVKVKDSDSKLQSYAFKFLTDEQWKFFPLNIYRITQILPVGDWTDPDDEIADRAKEFQKPNA